MRADRRTALVWMLVLAGAGAVTGVACGRGEGAEARRSRNEASTTRRPTYVDSVLPIEEEIRRFRASLTEEPTELRGGATSRHALVMRFVEALETRDTVALAEMALSRAEFAYLYYPHTKYTRGPYELSPALVWFQMQNLSSRGITRALARYGFRPLRYAGVRCEAAPESLGEIRVWGECVVRRRVAEGPILEERLFGSIVEKAGRYKFVSYGNSM